MLLVCSALRGHLYFSYTSFFVKNSFVFIENFQTKIRRRLTLNIYAMTVLVNQILQRQFSSIEKPSITIWFADIPVKFLTYKTEWPQPECFSGMG